MKDFIENENNKVSIIGEIASEFAYSHELYGERFYLVDVKVQRFSGTYDFIPVMVSDRLLDVNENYIGYVVEIHGQFRSFNKRENDRTKLILSVFAREIESVDAIIISQESNLANLEGFICKEPIYRKTPLGREITDLLLAVNRPYGKSDYIPCICWGRNARYAGSFKVGEKLKIAGRIQSRVYTKTLNNGTKKEHQAYEVSILNLEVIADEE